MVSVSTFNEPFDDPGALSAWYVSGYGSVTVSGGRAHFTGMTSSIVLSITLDLDMDSDLVIQTTRPDPNSGFTYEISLQNSAQVLTKTFNGTTTSASVYGPSGTNSQTLPAGSEYVTVFGRRMFSGIDVFTVSGAVGEIGASGPAVAPTGLTLTIQIGGALDILSIAGQSGAGSGAAPLVDDAETITKIELIRRASSAMGKPVRLAGNGHVVVVDYATEPVPSAFEALGDALYSSITMELKSGDRVLSLSPDDDQLTASATLLSDDTAVIEASSNGEWKLPGLLPVPGLGDIPTSSVSMSFTPTGFTQSVEFSMAKGQAPEDLRLTDPV